MRTGELDLAETLRKIRELSAKAKAVAEPILQQWEAEERANERALAKEAA